MPVQSRRPLLLVVRADNEMELVDEAERLARRYPVAMDLPLADVAEFYVTTSLLDQTSRERLLQALRSARVATPPALRFHAYRLGRHLLRRWGEPKVRSTLVGLYALGCEPGVKEGLQDPTPEVLRSLYADAGPMLSIYSLFTWKLEHLIPALSEALLPEQLRIFRAVQQVARVMMHRYLTEPEPTQLTLTELRAAKRRIRRHDQTLRLGRRNLYKLGTGQKSLLRHIHHVIQRSQTEVDKLYAIRRQAENDLAQAEMAHAQAVVAAAARHKAERADLLAQIEFAHADFSAALAIRNEWMPSTLLQGKTVAVVGDEERAEGYRMLIEGAGGRFAYASAVQRLQRISGAVGTADAVILLTGGAKHAAEAKLRRSLGPDTLYIRCARMGLGAFERTLRTEVIPRLATRKTAAGRS